MHIHILGICGKFMSGLAIIAKQMGLKVTGCDKTIIGPIAAMLQEYQIEVMLGYQAQDLPDGVELVIVGNALSRGVPIIERLLNENIPYISGPQWLHDYVLKDRWVVAVSGTHGKTTTSSMVTWILEQAGYEPGFLIGGSPGNFSSSARYTHSNFFVIEADEYDTAFFDKRSKFVHYHPRTLIINNLEFDHADIFNSLEDIKRQFAHLLRLVPSQGLIISKQSDLNVQSLFESSAWTPRETIACADSDWQGKSLKADCSEFDIYLHGKHLGTINWKLVGSHNIENALAAISAARHVGISPALAIQALNCFAGVKRRLELRGTVQDINVYDDFAHHPTAIATTLSGLRNHVGAQKIFAVLEFGSNTMKNGHHQAQMADVFKDADAIIFLQPTTDWNLQEVAQKLQKPVSTFLNVDDIIHYLMEQCRPGDNIICMSNLTFDNIHEKLLTRLAG